jgi:hypothetical protein
MSTYYTYPKFIAGALSGLTYKAMLLTDSSSGFDAAHDYVNDVSANEVSATGYARQTVSGAVTSDANGAYFTPSAFVEFPVMTASVRYIVIFADTSNDATSRVVGMIKFDSVVSLVAQKLRLNFNGALVEGAI